MVAGKKEGGYVVLMADANIEDHNAVKNAARKCGVNHTFTSVYNGAQLMEFLQRKGVYKANAREQPDLLIMDIQLDLVNGFEVLEFLKKNSQFTMPVYVLTKTKREEDIVKAKNLGVRGYFQKPLNYTEYQGIVEGICRESFSYNESHVSKNDL